MLALAILFGGALMVRAGGDDLPEAQELGSQAGIAETTKTWGAYPGDYNRDGHQDVVIVPHHQSSARLYRNVGGRFVRVPEERFPAHQRDRHDCDWGDVNGDDRPDLYCSIGGGKGRQRKPNELWIQRRNGSFADRAGEFRVKDLNGKGRDVAFLDADGDGLLDLYVANGFPRRDRFVSKNILYLNVDGERFRRAPEFGLNGELGGSRMQAADYDGDGWTDLLLCDQRDRLHLFRNRSGRRFVEVGERAGVGEGCRSAVLARMDDDDRLDLVNVSRSRLVVELQDEQGVFRRVHTRKVENAGDLAAGRVDDDDLDDLYVLQRGPIDDDRDDFVLLNRDGGRSFSELAVPQTQAGKADAVVSIDHDGSGRAAFIVMNGKNKARGPIRLVAFR